MIANVITCCRILISMLMFLFSVFSPEFYVCYLIAGISDMIDGTIARKLGTSSKFGEKLDTVADFVFTAIFSISSSVTFSINLGIYSYISLNVAKVSCLFSDFALIVN